MRDGLLAKVQAAIDGLKRAGACTLVALDGRCAAGKTTLAAQLQAQTGCQVVHVDDFFLRPAQRTAERLRQPGGNVDWERLLQEVLLPLRQGLPASFCPYDCHTRSDRAPIHMAPDRLTLIEGSYSCHPQLWDFYDLHIFLTVSPQVQLRRIRKRNGTAGAEAFERQWIPLEERYFQAFSIEKRCELRLESQEV